MLVSRDDDLVAYARAFRDYGKPDYAEAGLNFRMNEFTAALALVQIERIDEIAAWKNDVARDQLDPVHPDRLQLPDAMVSGLYKYIVFSPISRSTGKVYAVPCHRIMGTHVDLPNTDWVPDHHGAFLCTTELWETRQMTSVFVTGGSGFIGSHVVDRLLLLATAAHLRHVRVASA